MINDRYIAVLPSQPKTTVVYYLNLDGKFQSQFAAQTRVQLIIMSFTVLGERARDVALHWRLLTLGPTLATADSYVTLFILGREDVPSQPRIGSGPILVP